MLRRKRLLSLLLCLVMVLSFFPTALADGEDDGIILEDEHDHEGEDQGMIASVESEPVGAIQESPEEELDDDSVGDETRAVPETGDLVRVEFVCDPEEATVMVLDLALLDENGEPLAIEPEEDGSWLLPVGRYLYNVNCPGYWDAFEVEFAVENSEPITIAVQLVPVESDDEDQFGLVGSQNAVGDGSAEPQIAGEDVQAKLANMLAKYPDGSYWTSSFSGGTQCYGFAKLVVYNVFGKTQGGNVRTWRYDASTMTGMDLVDQVTTCTAANVQAMLGKARPGDVLQFAKGSDGKHQHSMIVYALVYNGSTITGAMIYECNWYGSSGSCQVTLRTLTNAQIAKRQTRSDGQKRGKLSLLTSKNWKSVNGGPYVAEYTFSFDPNGGSGSMSPIYANFGSAFTLPANTFTRSGYQFKGWYAKRDKDNTWYVSGQGWLTESQISSGGYAKTVYTDQATRTLNNSWTKGYNGKSSYTFYAIWEQTSLPGDVNGDGKVNGTDLIRLRRYLAGESVEIVAENTDVNGDGTINGMDLIRLRKYLAGEAVDLR